MSYNPATDGVALWRNTGPGYSKEVMPGLDFVMAALGRSGIISISVSATAPLVNQNTTAWFQPAAPSYSGEGLFFLWDPVATAYAPASAALLYDLLIASAGESGISWWMTAGGPPANTVGNNGDLALRTDFPGGIYGPKAAGAWPAQPIPGTTYAVDSTALDASFGNAPGNMLYRGAVTWQALPIGGVGKVLASDGNLPFWDGLSALLDLYFSSTQGAILYRDSNANGWAALAPSTAGFHLATQGAGANPLWVTPGAEFASGTVMVFRQTSAPLNWTKQTSVNDAGLRVTNGAVGSGGVVGFNTVFARTTTDQTTLGISQTPSHFHTAPIPTPYNFVSGGGAAAIGSPSATGNTSTVGGDGSHAHSIDLRLAYVDIIIATKN